LQPKPSAPSQPQTNKPQQTAPQQQPEKTNQGGIIVKVNRAIQRGNALAMDMDVRLPNIDLPSHGSMQITLVLIENTTKKNKQMYRLPPIIINGTNKRHMYERAVAISGEEAAKGGAYAVLKSDKDVTQFIQYKKVIPYKSWMSNCQLQLLCEEKNYNDKTIGQFANMVLRKVSITK
jgi:hypothetical protein